MRKPTRFLLLAVLCLGAVSMRALNLPSSAAERKITVTVYFGGQPRETLEKQVAHAPGMTAMDAVRKAARVETNPEGTFLIAIEGVGNSTERKEFWLYFVNGEPQHTGAAERKLAPGDRVLWFLRTQGEPGPHSD